MFFYREKGCQFCDKMKPVFESVSQKADFVCAKYALGGAPDAINVKYPIERFPTFYSFLKGEQFSKAEGIITEENLLKAFDPKPVDPSKAPMNVLISDELALIDDISVRRDHLLKIQAEIKRRRELAGV